MLIASFDIGEKNFAYCIAETVSEDPNQAINILKISHNNVMLKKTQTVLESCIRVSALMSEDNQLASCDRFVIEQQMRCNTRAQRLAQHVWSTLYARFPDRVIKFVPSHMKTQHFIGKNTLKDKERKTWSVIKVTQENVMGDTDLHRHIIEQIQAIKKKDDVCDTILQVIAYVDRDVICKRDGPNKPTTNRKPKSGRGTESTQHGGAAAESPRQVQT